MSFPDGPNTLVGSHNTVWMNYWRPAQFTTACNCWRVVERNFHPSYP
jgi:hypothetical protein